MSMFGKYSVIYLYYMSFFKNHNLALQKARQ